MAVGTTNFPTSLDTVVELVEVTNDASTALNGALTINATNFPAASGGAKSNGVAITFPAATASWGTVVAMGIFDAASSGNLLAWTLLVTAKTVTSGDTPSFPIGDVDITLD